MSTSVYSRTLQKAAELAGGHKALARFLHVPVGELEKWIRGQGTPPLGTFLKAVDLVLEETAPPPARSDPDETPPSRDCAPNGDASALF